MALSKGYKVTLKNTALYVSSTATKKAATKSGAYYIWSAATKNGRIRITNKKSYCGKNPAGKYVVGWINVSAIKNGTSAKDAAAKAIKKVAAKAAETITKENGSGSSGSGNTTAQKDPLIPTETVGMIGYLGTLRFIVKPGTVRTLNGFQWSSNANISEHERHGRRGKVEFTGMQAEEISFSMWLSLYAGTTPMTQYDKLRKWQRNGTVLPLMMGKTSYGYYRWLIQSLKFSGEQTDGNGEWVSATVSITLKAYEK